MRRNWRGENTAGRARFWGRVAVGARQRVNCILRHPVSEFHHVRSKKLWCFLFNTLPRAAEGKGQGRGTTLEAVNQLLPLEKYGRAQTQSARRLSRRHAMPISSFEFAAVATSQTGAERWDKRQRYTRNSTPRRRGKTPKNWSGDFINASSDKTKRSTRSSTSFRPTSPGSTARVDRSRTFCFSARPGRAKPASSKPRRRPCWATRGRWSRSIAASFNTVTRLRS